MGVYFILSFFIMFFPWIFDFTIVWGRNVMKITLSQKFFKSTTMQIGFIQFSVFFRHLLKSILLTWTKDLKLLQRLLNSRVLGGAVEETVYMTLLNWIIFWLWACVVYYLTRVFFVQKVTRKFIFVNCAD